MEKRFKILSDDMMISTAAAHKQPLHMKGNVSLISYSENECSSLPDQRIKCNNVIFTLKAVRVDDWRRK